jgi:uncharacterized OB-fold protein
MFRIDETPKGFDALQKATPKQHIPTGWKCPACGRINSPTVPQCPSCLQTK